MNASEAREKALAVNTYEKNSQYQKIISMVSKAADKGEYELYTDEIIKADVRIKLKQDGYTVGEPQSHRNETHTRISW